MIVGLHSGFVPPCGWLPFRAILAQEGSVKMLDANTLKVLEFLNEHPDELFSIYQMNQHGMAAKFETLDWLYKREMVSRYQEEDGYWDPYDGPDYIYQINAGGRSELRRQQHFEETEKRAQNAEIRAQRAEVRARISLVVSIIAVIVAWLK